MDEKTVPVSLVLDQIDAYRYAFTEAVLRANEAIKQRDCYRGAALKATCKSLKQTDGCPQDAGDPCPSFFGRYCLKCLKIVDTKARFL